MKSDSPEVLATPQQFCNEHIEASLDHWDMRTGRNDNSGLLLDAISLDHWDMRTGRNVVSDVNCFTQSLGSVENHSDMREWM